MSRDVGLYIVLLGALGFGILQISLAASLPLDRCWTAPEECERGCMNYTWSEEQQCYTCRCAEYDTGQLWEGDIILDGETQRRLEIALDRSLTNRAASSVLDRWDLYPDGKNYRIPYEINFALSDETVTSVNAAIADIHYYTCLRFVPRTTEEHYMTFYPVNGGCAAPVGRREGTNPIYLGLFCGSKGVILHEIKHSLGFWHEQSRPDRDDHIQILYENMQLGYAYNFQKYSMDEIDSLESPYDIGSVMHYPPYAFSKNGQPTIALANGEPLTGYQRSGFSQTDVEQINKMYGCNVTYETDGLSASTAVKASTIVVVAIDIIWRCIIGYVLA